MRYLLVLTFIIFAIRSSAQNQALCYEISNARLGIENSYLFATMHVMEEDHFFFPKKISKLLKRTEALCLEVKEISSKSMNPALLFDSTFSIKRYCDSNDWERLTIWAKETLLLNPKQFETIFRHAKPFLVLQFILSTSLPKNTKSHEIELEKMANSRTLRLLELEGVEAQYAIFDAIPYADQLTFIFDALKNTSELELDLLEMQEIYVQQKLQELCAYAINGFLKDYRTLFLDDRNKKWITKMENMMASQPTFFAVGAGHLCGENGLIELLKREGYTFKEITL